MGSDERILSRVLREKPFRRHLEDVARALQVQVSVHSLANDLIFRWPEDSQCNDAERATAEIRVGRDHLGYVECRGQADGESDLSDAALILARFVEERLQLEKDLASLSQELAERYEEIHLIHSLNESLGAVLEKHRVCQIALDFTLRAIPAQRASVMVYDEKSQVLRILAQRGLGDEIANEVAIRPGEGVSGFVFDRGEPLLVNDLQGSPEIARMCNHSPNYNTPSFLCAPILATPLQVRGKRLGVINLADRVGATRFTTSDLKILSTIASVTAIALLNCQLVEEAKATEAWRKEMEIAKTIQQSLLPRAFPKIPGGEIACHYEQAKSIGGDYYDLLRDETDYLNVVVADVSGHDIGSALLMVEARSVIRSEISRKQDPAEVLRATNSVLYEDLEAGGLFVSAFCARLDLSTWRLEYANAGHCCPIWVDGQTGSVRRLDAEGSIIGIWPDVNYAKGEIQLRPGDLVLFFTDGVTEAKSEQGQQFGDKRLAQLLVQNRRLSAEHICNLIRTELMLFTGNAGFADDVTMVVLKCTEDNKRQQHGQDSRH